MNRKVLSEAIFKKESFLCVGLDSDINLIPNHLKGEKDPVFEFNKQIIDATKDLCVSYKLNTAFYEVNGPKGWETMQKTLDYIPKDIFTIADAKRGDIGNTANMYARTFFESMGFDSVTLSPYMGEDSIRPFLEYEDKWAIILGVTSNAGAADFQMIRTEKGRPLYIEVLEKISKWKGNERIMFVAGATKADQLTEIRQVIPEHFLLVPGVGAQGGDLELVARLGLNEAGGLLVNSSRGIIFADKTENFAAVARNQAQLLQQQMAILLQHHNV